MGDQWVDIPLAIADSYGLTSKARMVNMMLLRLSEDSPRRFAIATIPTAGIPQITSGSGAMRGMVIHADKIWYVRGTQLYYSSNGSSATLVGTVSGTAKVRMVGAGVGQIAIVDGTGNQYTATTAGVSAFTLPAGVASDVAYMDGYIICPRAGTDEWYISALDGTTFAALDFSTADAVSDTLVGVISCNRDLFLLGKTHIEVWYNAGASPFPFVRSSPGVIERGCLAALVAQKADGMVHFVGDDRRAYRLRGYALESSSTTAEVEHLNLTSASAVSACVYSVYGQLIYSVNTTPGVTYELNVTTGLWHVRSGQDGFRANFTSTGTMKLFHAGEGTGAVVGICLVEPQNPDSAVVRSVVLPLFDAGGRRVFEHELELIFGTYGSSVGGTVTLTTDDYEDGSLVTTTHATISLNEGVRTAWLRLGSFKKRRQHSFTFTGLGGEIQIEAARARMDVGL